MGTVIPRLWNLRFHGTSRVILRYRNSRLEIPQPQGRPWSISRNSSRRVSKTSFSITDWQTNEISVFLSGETGNKLKNTGLQTPQTFIPSYLPVGTARNCVLDKQAASAKAAEGRLGGSIRTAERSWQPLVHVRAGLHDYPHLRMRFKNHSTGILALAQLNTS